MTRTQRTQLMRAPLLAPLALGVAALISCSDQPTAPSTSSLPLAGVSADRRESDRGTGAPATLAWEKTTRDLVTSHKYAPYIATRVYALHSLAQYAAVAAVGRGRDDDEGDGGDGSVAGSEALRGAIAGSSVQLLSALMPDAAAALEAQLAAFGADASGRTHPQFTRGVAIGRAAGDVMVVWSNTDGYSKVWNESLRNAPGPGIWEGSRATVPGTTTRVPPAGFQYPELRPYFLKALNGRTAQSQFRPPPPPAYLGSRFNADLAEVKEISVNRGKTPIDAITQQQIDLANLWNMAAGTVTTMGHWDEQAAAYISERGYNERAASHLFALLNAAAMDATIGCWEAKYLYLMLRPTMADKSITTVYALPNHPSYPSGHSCLSSTSATVLSRYFPEHAAQLNADMIDAGLSRIYGGIHYRFDIEAGQALGRSTAEWAMAYDRRYGVLAAIGLGEDEEREDRQR